MRKPWSISTTVRNPERIRDFLKTLKLLEGQKWDKKSQRKFQILLIKYKLYGYGNQQFYKGLSEKQINLINSNESISFKQAEEILDSKNYMGGGDMRGRQSFNPLEKLGFVFIDDENKIRFSAIGNVFLREQYDLGEVFFRCLLKWQLPNPDSEDFREEEGFFIKPFLSTLQLIDKVNKTWSLMGNDSVGISRKEFSLFVPTLTNYKDIEYYAGEIIKLRASLKKEKDKDSFFEKYSYQHISNFIKSSDSDIIKNTLNNLKDYTDNIIRYFRLTNYIYIRGNGYYIDLESRRSVELSLILKSDLCIPLIFEDRRAYLGYLLDIDKPKLPWENLANLREIASKIIIEIGDLEKKIGKSLDKIKNPIKLSLKELNIYVSELRDYRRKVQEEIDHQKSRGIDKVQEYIEILGDKIYSMEERALALEKYVTLGLNSLNDALRIKPNYPVGDDNEPTNTAPGKMSDIECFYKGFNATCEVTFLENRSQWFNEGQPVMRHLRDFEEINKDKDAFCLFIAPSIHVDTAETFWMAINYGYKGKKQNIVPLTINQFVELLQTLLILKGRGSNFTNDNLLDLYKRLLDLKGIGSSDKWINVISDRIKIWKEELISGIFN